MAVTVDIQEAEPAAWPDAPEGLSDAAAALDHGTVWARLEGWCAHRWGERAVVFTVEGPGDWRPPLRPVTVATVERWEGYAWTSATLNPAPLGGYELTGCGPYRFTGTVGTDDDPPASVLEAFRRLAEFWATTDEAPGAASYKVTVGPITTEQSRAATWFARAIDTSGAADLLRPYRNLGGE